MVTAGSVGAEGKAKIEKEIVTKAKKSQPLLALENKIKLHIVVVVGRKKNFCFFRSHLRLRAKGERSSESMSELIINRFALFSRR